MTPRVGNIYCVWEEQLEAYVAYQITHIIASDRKGAEDQYAMLQLHWLSKELPAIEKLRHVQPLILNFYFWDDRMEHSISEGPIPKDYIYIGELPVLVEEIPMSYSGWKRGETIYRQFEWEKIPENKRIAFKAASKDYDSRIEVGGIELPVRTSSLRLENIPNLSDYTELDRLPCLTSLTIDSFDPDLAAFLEQHHFIYKLEINGASGEVDLSRTKVTELIMNVKAIKSLILPEKMTMLHLNGKPDHELRIEHPRNGEYLTLDLYRELGDSFAQLHGLDRLESLELTQVHEADIGEIVERFPHLTSLRIWGRPGYIRNMDRLRQLEGLEVFTTMEMFGFTGEQFPQPDQLPKLHMLWLTSLPEEAAKSIKQTYKKQQGLSLSIRQPRKPEWLADNLDNPFRAWDGREGITAAQAKKAAALYKELRAQVRVIAANATESKLSTPEVQQQIEAIVSAYIEGFNKLDRRKVFIYTEEREEIFEAIVPIITELIKELKAVNIVIDENAVWEHTDELRDF